MLQPSVLFVFSARQLGKSLAAAVKPIHAYFDHGFALLCLQVSVDSAAAFCHATSTRLLIVELVLSTGPKFKHILFGRDALHADLTKASCPAAFARHFQFVREIALANGRIACLDKA